MRPDASFRNGDERNALDLLSEQQRKGPNVSVGRIQLTTLLEFRTACIACIACKYKNL